MGRLSGKVALITGAAQGIGRATAEKFLAEGAKVYALDREKEPLDEAIKTLGSKGQFAGLAGDVSKRADVHQAVQECVKKFGKLDILVANAGVTAVQPLLEIEDESWQRVLNVNLTGVMYCMQEAARVMPRKGESAIVVTASTNAFWVEAALGAYNASKGGVVALVRTAALDLAEHGIRVNAVEPGMVRTRLADFVVGDPVFAAEYMKKLPMGRLAEPSEVADAILFLAHKESSYITGQTLVLDGGLTLGLPAWTSSAPLPK